ncbi:hypothetical protein PHYBOEH_001405 [Phytophthora boehmeriae]|uniref:Uncharacterized protein n=1 Tax=Phytophthora boehmeriae TaxID=109152 RepID=A0A8T1XBJ8_9STRA|nr:hypothetical protein PHYBOEH_001405 [Phytophthora boehmeriae]
MSDEFNTEGRSFEAGDDHLWTALEKADGVNSALEVYSVNMTGTECDSDDNCYFFINTTDETIVENLWNDYMSPAGYQDVYFYYRSGMVQSWNKFCFQGGRIVVRAQLPGAVTNASGNPDVATGSTSVRAANIDYYPTWPGIWLMGNLGRAIFSASTSRMWPFTYNECNETVFSSQNQRVSACNDTPGHGLNANQGRGAPEIDILEGGGTAISSSLQVGPGMPENFRRIADNSSEYCYYSYDCTSEGANQPDVPTAYYHDLRGHKSWYQGLRYGANNLCDVEEDDIQTFATVNASVTKGITENACTMNLCPGSYDPNADLGYMNTGVHWGINANGTCFPKMNQYDGAFLCSAGNTDSDCTASSGSTDAESEFAYQMDAISSNWEIHLAAYLDWVSYSVEWVTGDDGYIRWEVDRQPIFEVTADVLTNPPQDTAQMNPKKIMIEEPMYVIFNVALSSSWGSSPPNAGEGDCYGDGSDEETNAICDSFPMYLKIDYIRLYQDTSDDTDMAIGCDPDTHPTKQWIEDNIDDYIDDDNPLTSVSGMAFCDSNSDCTISVTGTVTGTCTDGRCKCVSASWTGPRCTETASDSGSGSDDDTSTVYGPPMYGTVAAAIVTVAATVCVRRWLSSASPKPSSAYDSLVSSGNLSFDASQASIARRFLDKLHFRLDKYSLPVFNRPEAPESRKQDEDDQEALQRVLVPRGLYLYGGVGTGKSMLLDLFFRGAPVQRKRRVHFNEFMLEVQTRLAQEKKRQLEAYGRQRHIVLDESRDVVVQVAHSIADESHLLCFDEFQVTDVADALIMRKLFGVFFARGVVMIATSNTPPEDLYKDGTNREYFMPFLDQLARHTRVVPMNSDIDYRTLCEPVGGEETFLSPLTEATKCKMDEVYLDLLSIDGDNGQENDRSVQDELLRVPVMMGRTLDVRGSAQSGVCRASFRLLCDTEKGAADYKALAECFHTLVLDDVPSLSMAQHDQARRFILLVDELYEHRTRLVCSSEAAEPRGIFQFDDESVRAASEGANSPSAIEEEKQRINKENAAVGVPTTSSWDAPVGAYGPSQMAGLDVGNLVALKDLKVAFKRAVSRLREMQGEKYLNENRRCRLERAQQLRHVLQQR